MESPSLFDCVPGGDTYTARSISVTYCKVQPNAGFFLIIIIIPAVWLISWAVGVYRFRVGIVKQAEQLTDFGGPFTPVFYIGYTTKVGPRL